MSWKCYWLPWPDGLHILWGRFSSHTKVPSTVWHPDSGHPTCIATQRERDGSSIHGMSLFVTSSDRTATQQKKGRRGARWGVPRGQAEPRPLETLILDPFLLTCGVSWHERCYRLRKHCPALLLKPLLIFLLIWALDNVLLCLKLPCDQRRNL